MGDAGSKEPRSAPRPLATRLFEVADGLTGEVSSLIQRVAIEAAGASIDLGRAVLGVPDNPGLAKEAGAYLRELREVAGLTRDELSAAISLEDRALLEAVEEGTATLSFELVLRLAAIVARHDPVPFVMRFARTYSPEVWTRLEGLGPGRWPLQVERERRFVNIIRGSDAARGLSEEGFERLLAFTREAFELGLQYAEEQAPGDDD
jgi:transcriptional regulator with XRE-family HTH domain